MKSQSREAQSSVDAASTDPMSEDTPSWKARFGLSQQPLIAAVTMGYGHLRAAYPLADAVDTEVVAVDEPPLAHNNEVKLWTWVRRMHEVLSKPLPLLPGLERPMRAMMDAATMIPSLHEARDHNSANWSVHLMQQLVRRGLGRGMVERLRRTGAPLLTSFYAPALIADHAGIEEVYCVVTDADCNRVWAPVDASSTRIRYFAPSRRVVRRLISFGVPHKNITLTGFPLPLSLTESGLGQESLRSRVARRIARLDPAGVFRDLHQEELNLTFPGAWTTPLSVRELGPVTLTFAVGGAGAQAEIAESFLPSLRQKIIKNELRVNLIAGTRPEVRDKFARMVQNAGLDKHVGHGVQIVYAPRFRHYYDIYNATLHDTDVLWTKPSEMSFYAALGLPCIIAPPVGSHERYNRRWLREQGVGLKQRRADRANGWFTEWLEDGTLAAAAWSGFLRLPRRGTELILRAMGTASV
jgi:hypothetical protein